MSMRPQSTLFKEIQDILVQARTASVSAVNTAMVQAYWKMGKRIVEEEQKGEQRANYGEGIIKQLSKSLVAEFGKGFSVANLKNFRQFYKTFPEFKKSYALRSQLSWTHYRLIMRVESPEARHYYVTQCAEQKWSSRSLERNINSSYYQRVLSSQDHTGAGAVVGVTKCDEIQLKVKNRLRDKVCPSTMGLFDVVFEHIEGKEVIKITVASGLEKPYHLKRKGMTEQGCFIRVGSASEPMPQRMIEDLFSRRVRNSIGTIKSRNQQALHEAVINAIIQRFGYG